MPGGKILEQASPREAAVMTRFLLYMAPIALVAWTTTEAPAAQAVGTDSIGRDLAAATAQEADAPLVLVRRGGGGAGSIEVAMPAMAAASIGAAATGPASPQATAETLT